MSKLITFNSEARSKLKTGIDTVANAVKVTIGPRGKNVVIDRNGPVIANDGGIISREISLKDPVENMGAQLMKEVIQKTSEKVGGGRTATAILTQSLIEEGLKHIELGMNTVQIKAGMEAALKDLTSEIKKASKDVSSLDQLVQVATISTESKDLGEEIAKTVHAIGKDGIVTVEDAPSFGITTEFSDGLKFDKGYISPYMVLNPERMEAEYRDIPVFITDKKLSSLKDIVPILERAAGKKQIVIIAEDIDGECLAGLVLNHIQGRFQVLGIKLPGFGENKKLIIEDIAALTGSVPACDSMGIQDAVLGTIKKIIAKRDSTVIVGGNVEAHIEKLKAQKETVDSKFEKERFDERIAKLSNGVATIKVGAATEQELKYLKLKIEDGVNESKRALEEGIVPGGDVAFVNASKKLQKKRGSSEFSLGYNLVLKASEAPLRQIIKNGNGSPEVILNKIKTSPSKTIGYDANEGEVVKDMFKCGIIDAVKVTRTVLENAVSTASMFLTIEGAITEELEVKK